MHKQVVLKRRVFNLHCDDVEDLLGLHKIENAHQSFQDEYLAFKVLLVEFKTVHDGDGHWPRVLTNFVFVQVQQVERDVEGVSLDCLDEEVDLKGYFVHVDEHERQSELASQNKNLQHLVYLHE